MHTVSSWLQQLGAAAPKRHGTESSKDLQGELAGAAYVDRRQFNSTASSNTNN
jgi:hypothetical protein